MSVQDVKGEWKSNKGAAKVKKESSKREAKLQKTATKVKQKLQQKMRQICSKKRINAGAKMKHEGRENTLLVKSAGLDLQNWRHREQTAKGVMEI